MRARPSILTLVSLVGAVAGLAALSACESGKKGPQGCCRQPVIAPGVAEFVIVADDVSGTSDAQTVKMKAGFKTHQKRDQMYGALQNLYRFAMKRDSFEPVTYTGELYQSEADARSGSGLAAKITKEQADPAPRCEIVTRLDLPEQVKAAFDWSMGLGVEEDLSDTCHLAKLSEKKKAPRFDEKFKLKPTFKLDPGAKAVEVTYPYTEMGKDEYLTNLTFNNAMTYWAEFTTTMFKKSDDLQQVTYSGVMNDESVLRITVTRAEFDKNFSNVQETIAAHSAITFASLGLHKTDDKGALAEQESFKTKVYLAALSSLAKDRYTVSPKLSKSATNVKMTPKGIKKG